MNLIASQVTAGAGILVSAYATYVDMMIEKNQDYVPACEIGSNASCKTAFKSEYGKTFGISNSIIGIFSYIAYLIATIIMPGYAVYLAVLAVIGSAYLAYVSYVKMRNVCIICTAIYVINILLLVFALV